MRIFSRLFGKPKPKPAPGVIRLWKMGSLDHNLIPTDPAVEKLRSLIAEAKASGNADIVIGPDVDVFCVPADGFHAPKPA